jgi:hypothetical protein
VWVKPYEADKDPSLHHFIFFLKPEATAFDKGVKVDAVLELALDTLRAGGVEFGAIRVLGGEYLDEHDLMVQHYGVIAKISKNGRAAISEGAEKTLQEKFEKQLAGGAKVLGGHQFLAEQKEFNAFSLVVLNDTVGTVRLAGGTYALEAKVVGKSYILLNPFHPYQTVPYTTPGHAIIVFECFSKTPWADLRGKLAGVTDPKDAAPGSIRNLLLQNKDRLGFGDVDKGTNGVHMSAGPLEGMVELQRFFTDHEKGTVLGFDHTSFGRLLAQQGLSGERIEQLASNINVAHEGKNVSVFDLTEEKDSAPSAEILAKVSQ